MKREFLQNLKVNEQPLPKEIIDASMAENGRDIGAVKSQYEDYDTILDCGLEDIAQYVADA